MTGNVEYQQSLRRNRYAMSNLSSPVTDLAAQYDALDAKGASDSELELEEEFPQEHPCAVFGGGRTRRHCQGRILTMLLAPHLSGTCLKRANLLIN